MFVITGVKCQIDCFLAHFFFYVTFRSLQLVVLKLAITLSISPYFQPKTIQFPVLYLMLYYITC